MAPKSSDDFDVFKIPHSRMKQLVNSCNKKLTITDFANNDALLQLLNNLDVVFKEFKSHEEIENEHIMTKLKQKLKAMAIYNSAVCNCHKEDEFTPLMQLVDVGYMYIDKRKTTSERISFGVRLRKALNQFTRRFVPHMKEEEEIFQPLLMEHFTRDELIEMKNNVIKMHLQKRKLYMAKVLDNLDKKASGSKLSSSTVASADDEQLRDEKQQQQQNGVCVINEKLPNEILLKIFSNLKLNDKFKVAQVCRKWNELVYSPSNWQYLEYKSWSMNQNQLNMSGSLQSLNGYYYHDRDESFDYSGDDDYYNDEQMVANNKSSSSVEDNGVRVINYWVRSLLPRVGIYVRTLNLSYCKSLDNNLVRRILRLCPNLTSLDISYTRLGDNSFRNIRLDYLEHFNCEGCENISDNAFKYILIATITASLQQAAHEHEHEHESEENSGEDGVKIEYYCGDCTSKHSIEELHMLNNKKDRQTTSNIRNTKPNGLKYINLSGCWSITDFGLKCIASKYSLNKLNYLNLSGCINLSSDGINLMVNMSQLMNGENLYYCDNISDGPLSNTANGCENLECGKKFCCRNNSN